MTEQAKNIKDEGVPLQWVARTKPEVLAKMFPYKLKHDYQRPSRLDIEAQKAIIISKRATCLFYEVGATIFHVKDGNFFHLSDGYNGPAKGDVDPRFAGCARVVDGDLKEGAGHCRGSHGELNSVANAVADRKLYEQVTMMVTLHPCHNCAKHIANSGITTVYYIWEYGREEFVTDYLKGLGIKVERYTSPFLEKWIELNGYHAVGRCCVGH